METVQGSQDPSFERRMTPPMLERNARLMIPSSFIRTHGQMLDAVISLTGPIGHTHSVAIKTYPPSGGIGKFRFFLGVGWKEFVQDNGFQVGDLLLFTLRGRSFLHVVVSKPQVNAVYNTPVSLEVHKCDRESRLGRNQANRDFPKCEFNSNPVETSTRPWRGIAGDGVRGGVAIVYPLRRAPNPVKYPGLHAAISSNSGFPQFISMLSKSNLSANLELPIRFAKEYGHEFQERVVFRGPRGGWRLVKLKVYSTIHTTIRVHVRHGWRAFARENELQEGDLLLFALVGTSKFVVQVFHEANPSELSGLQEEA